MDRFTMKDYYDRSLKPGTMVVVKENGDEISGLALLLVNRGVITVDMLAKNILVNEKGVGVRLLNFVEEVVADQLGINSVRLDSIDREKLISFYRSRGYVSEGPPVRDREWGLLHPMRKRIVNLGS